MGGARFWEFQLLLVSMRHIGVLFAVACVVFGSSRAMIILVYARLALRSLVELLAYGALRT